VNRRGFRPSKERGQNFLVDKNLARKFILSLAPSPEDLVLEIGPGSGALTAPLLETGCRVLAVEIQPELVATLESWQHPRLKIVQANYLRLDPKEILWDGEIPRLALSNVPYSVTGVLLPRLLQGGLPIDRFVVGVQREVADRLVALPGCKDYSSLTVLAQAYGTLKRVFKLSPHAYRPRPKVHSAAVLAVRNPERELIPFRSPQEKILRAAFAHRRKTLCNSLSGRLGLEKEVVTKLLVEIGIAPGRRAETLNLEEFRLLAREFCPVLERSP
jgi:16S rRNA (adenine1518-N6/adenine1519-N6)-dimethyltransferase